MNKLGIDISDFIDEKMEERIKDKIKEAIESEEFERLMLRWVEENAYDYIIDTTLKKSLLFYKN